MNCITPTSRITHCNKSYSRQIRRLAGAVVWLGLAFSPTAVLAADIIANPNNINTDHSGDNAYGVKETVNDAENGVVKIQTGGIIDSATGGYSDSGNAKSNQVTVSGGTVNWNVEGGYSDSGYANNNQVSISAGKVNYVIGGYSDSSYADNNQVTINGGTVNGNAYGGFSDSGNANNNQVTITGGTFTNIIAAAGGVGTVKDNTLTISGGSFANSVDLYGYDTGGTPATASGNSIHLKVAGLTINNIAGVNNLYFYLPNNVQNGDSVAILQDTAAAGTDLSSTVVGVCAAAGSALAVGDEITLIDAAGTLQTSSDTPANDTGGMTGCGTVSGLNGTLVLQNNGGDNLTLMTNGAFTFATPVANGGSYAVSVLAQPAGQNCSVNNAGGTVNGGPVTNIAVTCQTTGVPQQGTAQPVPGLGGKTLALLMLILAAITAWFIHRRSATVL